jgi:hypothetical protein
MIATIIKFCANFLKICRVFTKKEHAPWIRLITGSTFLIQAATSFIALLSCVTWMYAAFQLRELKNAQTPNPKPKLNKEKLKYWAKMIAWFAIFSVTFSSCIAVYLWPKFLFTIKLSIFFAMLASTLVDLLNVYNIQCPPKLKQCASCVSTALSSCSLRVKLGLTKCIASCKRKPQAAKKSPDASNSSAHLGLHASIIQTQ